MFIWFSYRVHIFDEILLLIIAYTIFRKGETFDGFVARKHLVNTYGVRVKTTTQKAFLQKNAFIKVKQCWSA